MIIVLRVAVVLSVLKCRFLEAPGTADQSSLTDISSGMHYHMYWEWQGITISLRKKNQVIYVGLFSE